MSSALKALYDKPYIQIHHSGRRPQQGQVDFQRPAKARLGKPALKASHPSPPMSRPPSPPLLARSMAEVEVFTPNLHTSIATSVHETIATPLTTRAILSNLSGGPLSSSAQSWPRPISSMANPSSTSTAPRIAGGTVAIAPMDMSSLAERTSESRASQILLSENQLEGTTTGMRQNVQRTRPTRRTKAHVASACVNCKRAHLSCDIQRPCIRCVATGKQDSCVDVQHKKRGRPRIREEQEIGRPGRAVESSHPFPGALRQGHELLVTNQRQIDPGRNLRSYKGNIHPAVLPTPSQGVTPTMSGNSNPASVATPSMFPSQSCFASQIPVILMDLDFTVLKTNSRFRDLVSRGNDIRGYSLNHFLASGSLEVVRRIRNELREEREAREPSYLPPIITPGEQGAVEGIAEENLDLVTSGYINRLEMLTLRLSSGQLQNVAVCIKLARTSLFFVALSIQTSNGKPQYPGRQHFPETQTATSPENLESPYITRSHTPYAFTTRPSPLHSFQTLSTSLPPVSISEPTLPLSSAPQQEYLRNISATPATNVSVSASLLARSESAYGAPSMKSDVLGQTSSASGLQQPQLPPIAGMISSSRESSEQSPSRQEQSRRSRSGTQEREDPSKEPKRRRLDISDVLE